MNYLIKFCFSLALSLIASLSFGQTSQFGLRLGLNVGREKVTDGANYTDLSAPRFSFMAGVYVVSPLSKACGLQTELYYSAEGSNSGTYADKLSYVNLPILFRYNANDHVHLLIGPQAGVLVSAKNNGTDILNQFKTSEFSGVFGVGFDFGHFNCGVRYNIGFT